MRRGALRAILAAVVVLAAVRFWPRAPLADRVPLSTAVWSADGELLRVTLAADDLGLPRSTVTDAVKQLEARLGVRLLERTTRRVSPTLDGEAYHRRCLTLIADVEEAEAAFGGARPKGLLRVEYKDGALDVRAGQAVITQAGEWIRYSTPEESGAEYIAVCLPAFSMETVHRD